MQAIRLRTEYLENPVGIGTRQPRLLWNCSDGVTQTAFEIEAIVDGKAWHSGKQSGATMHFDWPANHLHARSQVSWRIRLWDEQHREGPWSEIASFELGLLQAEDWKAQWISGQQKASRKGHLPIDCFRKIFTAHAITKARLYASALGMYEIHLNGQRVGDAVLTPGATDHRKHLQAQTYDVTALVTEGENTLTAELAGGWFKSYLLSSGASAKYGSQPALLVQLELTDDAGNITVIGTDETWNWSNDGPVRFAEMKQGEIIDARLTPSWMSHARRISYPVTPLPSDNVPMRKKKVFTPDVIRTPAGQTVLDFGQNIAGFVRFAVRAKAGQKLTLKMGEWLEKGEFTQRNIIPGKKGDIPFQKTEYTCRDGLNEYETRFAIYGFQYVLVEADFEIVPEDFSAIAVSSDMEETAIFHSDHALVNKLVDCTLWSARNNSADVPTDCPTRERVGWTGDAQIFCQTASYLFDYAAFGRKYMQDLRDAQYANGSYTQAAPRCAMSGFMKFLDASAGWADAGVLIPYRLWKQYGDERLVQEHYASMKAYGKYLMSRCGKQKLFGKKVHLSREASRFIVGTGLSYGEWLEPKEAVAFSIQDIAKPHLEENTAYTAYSFRLLKEIAQALGEAEDAKCFGEYEQGCTQAYRELVLTPEYSLDTDRQAKLVRPLYMDLLDEGTAEKAKHRLLQALEHFGWRVGTGFLSTPFLLFVLEDIGLEYAYRLLENEAIPGWLAMPRYGATTIWENWEGTEEENPVSLDHYSKGAVCEWIFSSMCGIRVTGENRFLIAPKPGGSLRHASLHYQSVYGEIGSTWERYENETVYTIQIPANTTAKAVLPDGTHELTAGTHVFTIPH